MKFVLEDGRGLWLVRQVMIDNFAEATSHEHIKVTKFMINKLE